MYDIITNREVLNMIRFDSDYTEGCIPEILQALNSTNEEQTIGYMEDPHCANARRLIQKWIGREDADVHFMVGGTQANVTVIASVLKHYQGAVCADSGHINVHETGALEAAGHKCLALPNSNGKISAAQVDQFIVNHYNDAAHEHIVQPGIVYISFPTESGTLYSKKELSDLYAVCQKHDIPLFIDGARLGYGLASSHNDVTIEELARMCDIFYIGGTKVGAMFGEAIVILNDRYKKDFRYHIKQRFGMLAKGRMLGIQFEELFRNGKYMEISRHAIAMGDRLIKGLQEKGYEFRYTAETNQLFPILTEEKMQELSGEFAFSHWEDLGGGRHVIRFVTSFMTKEENVDKLIAAL